MPFDINAILAAFEPTFKPEWKRIVDAFKKMGEKIGKQAERSSMLERASRDFIEWPFQQDALVLQITPSQKFQFPPISESLLPDSIRQEWLLPGLFIRLKGMTATVRDAIARFNAARPEMFNPSGTRFTDIFGHAALLVHAFVKDYRPIHLLEEVVANIGEYLPAKTAGSEGEGSTPAGSLDSVPAMIGGMLLLIPAALEWLEVLARQASLYGRIYVLQHLESIQASLYSFKNEFFTTYFETLREMFQGIVEFAFAVQFIFLRSVVWYGAFVGLFIRHIARQLSHYSATISHAVNLTILALQAVAVFGGPLGGIVSSFADARGGPPLRKMPDVFRRGLVPHVSKMKSILHELRDALVPGVSDLLNASGMTMLSIADTADKSARTAVTVGSEAILRNLNASSTAVAETAFAGPIEERRARLQEHPDELANAYDRSLAAGLGVIQAAIPRYIGGAIQWWRSRQPARLQGMTSPHIMARRARLRRVRLTHLRMQVHGFDMQSEDRQEDLLARLQDEMRNQVELAWGKGELVVAQ